MRRLVLVFMLLLLPLQWSWAAAASVCKHEQTSAAANAHFGHHEHEHADAAKASSDAPAAELPGSHPDCHTCHGMSAGCVAAAKDDAPRWHRHAAPIAFGTHVPEPPIEALLRPPMPLVALNG